MGHASVAARLSIYAAYDPEPAGVSTMAAGIYPAPLPPWSYPGLSLLSPSPDPRVRAVRGLPGLSPAAPLGLGLGQSLVQEGAGMGECAILQELLWFFMPLMDGFGHLDIPSASPGKFRDSSSRADTIPMGHVSVAARLSNDAGFDSGAAGVSTMAAGIYPAPLPPWSYPGLSLLSPSPDPRVRAVRGLPGLSPAAPLGLGLGQSLVQEGAGMGECAISNRLKKPDVCDSSDIWTFWVHP